MRLRVCLVYAGACARGAVSGARLRTAARSSLQQLLNLSVGWPGKLYQQACTTRRKSDCSKCNFE